MSADFTTHILANGFENNVIYYTDAHTMFPVALLNEWANLLNPTGLNDVPYCGGPVAYGHLIVYYNISCSGCYRIVITD
jgi:hypothetical protein